MKKIKRILAALAAGALCVAALSSCGQSGRTLDDIKKSGKIVMYTNAAFAPFEYKEGEKVVGVDVDIANEIAKDLGVELEIKDVEFSSVLAAIPSGKGDFGASGLSVTPEREKQMDFSIKYVKSVQYIIVPEDVKVTVFEDLAGKKIGVQTGTTGETIVNDEINGYKDDSGKEVKGVLQDSGASCSGYSSAMNAVQDLQAGRIDAVVIDKLPAEAIVAKNTGIKCLELVYADGSKTEEEYAIAVRKGNKELLDQINSTLQRLIDEGKIDEFLVNHVAK
ncbi:MAG: amino acid transporter substrate-binding protein family [Oscillospiraceae bacterium]|jgi:polar amino acid transport system substrate-binding protein|nr:amino acid transporter substrate-binding protein family [Oscillospiraceae bacterium]